MVSVDVKPHVSLPSFRWHTPILRFGCALRARSSMHPPIRKREAFEISKRNLKSVVVRPFIGCIAPSVWNSLSVSLQNLPALPMFKTQLKTYLFHKAFHRFRWTMFLCVNYAWRYEMCRPINMCEWCVLAYWVFDLEKRCAVYKNYPFFFFFFFFFFFLFFNFFFFFFNFFLSLLLLLFRGV